jgi:threonine dehydratase
VLNFDHVLRYVDGIVAVPEEEIRAAMRIMLVSTGLVAEPSGAITLAAALFRRTELPACRTVVAVLSGGNIDPELKRELEEGAGLALPQQRG